MSQQAEHEQQPLTPEEMRQQLTELGIDQQVITELSDEQLEQVAGGSLWGLASKEGLKVVGKGLAGGAVSFGFSEYLKHTFE
jgi:hypothetical protein